MVGLAVEKKLYDAATMGDVATLQQLLQQDPYLVHGVSFPCSRNLLHIAAMHGQTAIVEQVLKLNPRLARISDTQKSSPLHIAAEEGHVEICQKLLSVAPEACWWRDGHDMNPLHIAAMKGHVEIVERLLQENPSPAMERLRRRETVLHLCVKHGQLRTLKVFVDKLGEEFVHATDEDGDTIMHLAVRCNQFEIIQYLVESNKVKRETENSMGKTELQILDQSPRGTNSSYSEIRRILSNLLPPSIHNYLPKLNDTTMVVVVLIATMAFQNAVNPPGGVWQDDTASHKAGEAVIAYTHPHIYKHLVRVNTIAFGSSLVTIFLITTGEPSRNVWAFRIALCAMWVSLIAIGASYGASTTVIASITKATLLKLIIITVISVCVIVVLVIFFFFLLRIFYFYCKRKIRRQVDLPTDPLPERIIYRICQRLEACGCLE